VKSVKRKRIKKAPRIAATPTTSGIAEATMAPKTKTKRINVAGIEIASARAKSLEIFLLIAFPTTPTPPEYSVNQSTVPS
jgi:hypothetical protein